MVSMPINTGCNYHLPISYNMNNSDHHSAKEALIRFGVLGPAENYTWKITTICQGVTDVDVSIVYSFLSCCDELVLYIRLVFMHLELMQKLGYPVYHMWTTMESQQ